MYQAKVKGNMKKLYEVIMEKKKYNALAITMWDFSWIERNWPGAGFDDIDKALDELVERGYNAVRIDWERYEQGMDTEASVVFQ